MHFRFCPKHNRSEIRPDIPITVFWLELKIKMPYELSQEHAHHSVGKPDSQSALWTHLGDDHSTHPLPRQFLGPFENG